MERRLSGFVFPVNPHRLAGGSTPVSWNKAKAGSRLIVISV
jgi:hypothetical protein